MSAAVSGGRGCEGSDMMLGLGFLRSRWQRYLNALRVGLRPLRDYAGWSPQTSLRIRRGTRGTGFQATEALEHRVMLAGAIGEVTSFTKISDTAGGFTAMLESGDEFGSSVTNLGDLNGDGVNDLAVGASRTGITNDPAWGAVHILFMNSNGTVKSHQTISDTEGNFTATLDDFDEFGRSVAAIGDIDGDGVVDLAVGAIRDDDGGDNRGAVYVLFLNTNGTVKSHQKISSTQGSLPNVLGNQDQFGISLASVGDLDGDGITDLAVGAHYDDDGGNDRGAVYLLFLRSDGTVKTHLKISETSGGSTPTLQNGVNFGSAVTSLGDLDGDGIVDLAVGAYRDDDGGTEHGAVYVLFLNAGFGVKAHQKISDTQGLLTASLHDDNLFGHSLANAGDLNGDGINDLIVGAGRDDDGGNRRGAAYVLFLNSDGTVKFHQKISDTQGAFTAPLGNYDYFGSSLANLGDIDGDGLAELAIGARDDNDDFRGAVYILSLEQVTPYGVVTAERKISDTVGNFTAVLDDGDFFGQSVAELGDLDGDGIVDLVVGASLDDDSGPERGAVYVLFMNVDGTVKSFQKISDTSGSFTALLNDTDHFGASVTNLGDLDGDGVTDIAVGARLDDDGGADRGAVYVLFMNTNGSVKSFQKISDTVGGFTGTLDDGDSFGDELATIGDLDGDGVTDLAVAAHTDDDGGTNRGAVYVLFMNTDGTVKSHQKISDTQGGFTGVLADSDAFSSSITGLGDLDGDGVIDLMVGAQGDVEGAVYVLFMNPDGTVKLHQKISDATPLLSSWLDDSDSFSVSMTTLGDLDGDGVVDVAVGAHGDDDGGSARGAIYVLFLNADGTLKSHQKISDTQGNFGGGIDTGDLFGTAIANMGDLDGDGLIELAVGTRRDDDGGTNRGAVYILSLEGVAPPLPFGVVTAERKISDTLGNFSATLDDFDQLGNAVSEIGDLDGDGVIDLVVGAERDDDGGNYRGAVYVLFLNADGTVKSHQKISDTQGNFTATLDDFDLFGNSLTNLGDMDGDGVPDLAVGAPNDDDGDVDIGAVYVLFLNADGTVKSHQKISDTEGNFSGMLGVIDRFGSSVASIGDLDGDDVPDLVVGSIDDDDGGNTRGAVYVLFLNTDGTVKSHQKISDTQGNFLGDLNDNDRFGSSISSLGDLDKDGVTDIGVGAINDDGNGVNRGAVYVLFLNSDGTVKEHQKINDAEGNFTARIDDADRFGKSITSLGDLDGDGIVDIAVGTQFDDDGGAEQGAVYVLFLNEAGTVKSHQKISDTAGNFFGTLNVADTFGSSLANIGDLDGDGTSELAVGAPWDDDGGTNRGAMYILSLKSVASPPIGSVIAERKISDTAGDFDALLDDGDRFGQSVADLGDLDGDGIHDLAVGAPWDDDGGGNRGAVNVLFMNADGTVRFHQKISDTDGNFTATLDNTDLFGTSVAGLGDLDGDGVADLAVGAYRDDDGGSDRGAVYVLFLNADGTVKAHQKISNTTGGFSGTLDDFDEVGNSLANLGDLNGDGINDLAVGVRRDDDGGGARGAVYVLFMNTNGTVQAHQKISDTAGNFTATLEDFDFFGSSLANMGDLDGDGVNDLTVGAKYSGSYSKGAVYVLFMNSNGTVKAHQKIDETNGALTGKLDIGDNFGGGVANLGDLDGDGTQDMAVGAGSDDDGGSGRGAVHILFLNPDGTVKGSRKVSDSTGNLTATLDDSDFFGESLTTLGDLDGDGLNELVVGARFDDDGGINRGAVYILSIEQVTPPGVVIAEQKISDTEGGFTGGLADNDFFGQSAAELGDLDGDGVPDVAIGVRNDNDGGSRRGAVYVLFLNPDGTVKAHQKISDTQGHLTAALGNFDYFGTSIASLGDLDGDGITDLAVGTRGDDDGAGNRGAVYMLFLNADGTVKSHQKISDTAGNLTHAFGAYDSFGTAVTNLGDLDGDGVNDLAVGVNQLDPYGGGLGPGATIVLFLNSDGTVKSHQELSSTQGNLGPALVAGDSLGGALAGIGDLDGDGIQDLAMGIRTDDGYGGAGPGALLVTFLNSDGTVKSHQRVDDAVGNFTANLSGNDRFGWSMTNLGDLDGDGVTDLAVGAIGDDDGGNGHGAVYVLFMNSDGTVKSHQKISDTQGNFNSVLETFDTFGSALANVGDLDGDGKIELAVAAFQDDDGGSTLNANRGAMYILSLAGVSNFAPTVALTNATSVIGEDVDLTARFKVADIVITDDAAGVNVLSLAGADAGLFEIDGTELFLKAGASLSYGSNPVLDVVVRVNDFGIPPNPNDAAALSIVVTPPLHYDFGTSASPVASGFTPVIAIDAYDVSSGFGWSGSVFGDIDRGVGDDLQRDFVYTKSTAEFLVDLPNGTYDVTVLMGDKALQDNMQLSLEGAIVDVVSTAKNTFHQMTYPVILVDGQLTLGLEALGGLQDNALINSLVITPTGDLQPGLVVVESDGDTVVDESGTTDTLMIRLTTMPTSDVVLMVSSGDTGEASVAPTMLTFTPGNYATPQLVTVTGEDDLSLDGDQLTSIVISVIDGSSADEYDTVADTTLSVTTFDDDVSVPLKYDFGQPTSPLATGFTRVTQDDAFNATDGFGWTGSVTGNLDRGTGDDQQRDFVYTKSTASFLVNLPNDIYDVTILMGDASFTQDNMQLSLEGVVADIVTTTAGNYHEQTYRVTVADGQLTVDLEALGGQYDNALINALTITPASLASPGILIASTDGATSVDESGTTDTLLVSLSVQPTSDVVLMVSSSDTGEATVSPAMLTFTPMNWSTPQPVMVTGVDDGDIDFDQLSTVIVSVIDGSSADEYDSVADATAQVTTTDDETDPALRFDFGKKSSPLASGFTQITKTSLYNAADGFGFTGSVFGEIDRGTGDDEQRDFVYTRSSMDFRVDVTNGLYDVAVLMGDEAALQDNMQLSLEGTIVDTVTTSAGNYHLMTYQVTVTDGQLTVGLTALGGTYNNALINSLVITPSV
ncbi:MAG: FG-GAP repeat protein [Planctomycetaceae bacterium]|nr:FG-GAP repeat protein [Planctomycetaceae bacterium]